MSWDFAAWAGRMTSPDQTDGWTLVIMVGLGCVTLAARCFFFLSDREVRLPGWVNRGLQYAPTAALAAVIAPEVLMQSGRLVTTLADARIWGAVAAGAYFFAMRLSRPNHSGVLGTIIAGLAIFLPLRLGLGW